MTTRTFTFSVVAATDPAWALAIDAGEVADIGSNSINAVNPTGATNQGVVRAWCGGVYAPGLGTHGSYLHYGGGHSDYQTNELYRFDLDTAAWSVLVQPSIAPPVTGASGYATDTTLYEYYNGSGDVIVGALGASHTYGKALWTPQGSFGSDSLGYYVIPNAAEPSNSPGPVVYGSTSTPHHVPLSSPVWTRHTEAFAAAGGIYGPALYDSLRNRLVKFTSNDASPNATVNWLDLDDNSTGSFAASSAIAAYYATAFYDSVNDLYIVANFVNYYSLTFRITLINPTTGAVTLATMSSAPSGGTGGFDWIPSLKRLIYKPGTGNVVYWAQQPTNPLTETWAWTAVTLTGTVTAQDTNDHYSRCRYVESLDLFFWLPSYTAQQAFRLW